MKVLGWSIHVKHKKCFGSYFSPFFALIGSFRFNEGYAFGLERCFVGKRRTKVWQVAICLFWTVWKTRNKIVFKEDVLSLQKLKYLFILLLWSET